MITNLPIAVSIVFLLITTLTIYLFYSASTLTKKVSLFLIVLTVVHSILAYTGFYLDKSAVPPRLGFVLLPMLILIFFVFSLKKGKEWITSFNIKKLTLLHTIRIPVELVLYWLFLYKAVPEIMTFDGLNFDIIAGITAPILYYLVFIKKKISYKGLLIWNIFSLVLLLNIIVIATLSAPTIIQQLSFDSPNVGILYFPFILLPAIVVPIVLFAHFVAIKRLISFDKEKG